MESLEGKPLGLAPQEHLEMLRRIPQHEQRSDAWFKQRENKLTSSDAGTVLGLNPYEKPVSVLFKKCGHGKKFKGNKTTQWGQDHEDEAIGEYCKAMGKRNHDFGLLDFDDVDRPDDVHSRDKYPDGIPWMAGSTDGVAEDLGGKEGLILLEVKCPPKRAIKYGECPKYYYPQVQLNMAILNIEKADFIEYKPPDKKKGTSMMLNIVRIHRDREWFDDNFPILEAMWNSIVKWRAGDITEHPEYEKFHKKLIPRPARKSMFIDDSESDSESD